MTSASDRTAELEAARKLVALIKSARRTEISLGMNPPVNLATLTLDSDELDAALVGYHIAAGR